MTANGMTEPIREKGLRRDQLIKKIIEEMTICRSEIRENCNDHDWVAIQYARLTAYTNVLHWMGEKGDRD